MVNDSQEFINRFSQVPKYVKLAEQFRSQIVSGEFSPGDRLPSFAELRDQLGVGQSTLERAYLLLEEESLITREPGRGIFVAPPRHRQRTGTIGLFGVTPEKAEHPYFARLVSGVQYAASIAGMELLLLNNEQTIRPERLDGVVIYSYLPDLIFKRLPANLPRVVVLYPTREAPCVLADDFGGAHAATRHLLSLGHRRIAYLSAPSNEAIYRERLKGYHAALREAGIEPQARWVQAIASEEITAENPAHISLPVRGRAQMAEWLQNGFHELRCTALLVHNDDVAMGVLQALAEIGISVPHDLSVMGFDDTFYSRMLSPALSTVRVPLAEIGTRATELLQAQMEEIESGIDPRKILDYKPELLETPVVVRESTAPPPSHSCS